MKKLLLVLALLVVPCSATSYYVDCVIGIDKSENPGTSPSSPWKTLGRVTGYVPGQIFSGNATLVDAGFNGGDTLYLKRGCTWDWHMTIAPFVAGSPPTGNFNGTNVGGPVFAIDAYGNGAPPTFQAEIAAGAWTNVSGNIYKATIQSVSQGTGWFPSNVNAVKFGSVWGNCKGQYGVSTPYCVASTGTAALAANFDWYYSSSASGQGCIGINCGTVGQLYVFDSIGSNPTVDFGTIKAPLDGGAQLVSIAGVSNVTVQHLKFLNQSWYGIEVSGAADYIILANIYSDTEVPLNFHGVGFYLHPSGAASHIQVLATEAHRGYYGYQFSGGITAATVSNCKAYFNRAGGLADLTVGAASVTYDHCHFYGNGVGSPNPNDTSGGIAGAGNIAVNTDPHVKAWQNYTPRFALNFQVPGAQYGSDAALNAQLSSLGGAPLSIGIATNFSLSTSLISQFQTWIDAGYDLNSMGLSAASYGNRNVLNLQYKGSGSAAALTVTGSPATSFAITVTGASADNFTFPITSTTTMSQLKAALFANPKYTVAWPQPCGSCSWLYGSAMLAQDLLAVSGQDVKTGIYSAAIDPDQFLTDEASKSKTWMNAHLTFGGGHKWLYLYPGELFNPGALATIEGDVSAAGYDGARGTLSMQFGRDGLAGALDAVAANGVDIHGLSTFALIGWSKLTPVALRAAIQAAVEQNAVWGVPVTLYWQSGDISNAQLALVIADLQAAGATLMDNSGIVTLLTGKTSVGVLSGGGFCACWAWGPDGAGTIDLSPTYLSPTVGTGATLTGYEIDLNGVLQPQTWSAVNSATSATVSKAGWDIGSQALVPSFTGGLTPGH